MQSTSTRAGYQAGLGIDYVIANNKEQTTPVFLFVKAGICSTIGKDVYKIEGVKYDPRITPGDWQISVGFKFARKE